MTEPTREPTLGEKKGLIEHAVTNAREALGRKMAESSSQAKLLAGAQQIRKLTEELSIVVTQVCEMIDEMPAVPHNSQIWRHLRYAASELEVSILSLLQKALNE